MGLTKKNHPLLRALAAALLFMWVASQSLCAMHCAIGGESSPEESAPPCHSKPKSASSGPCDSSKAPSCLMFSKASLNSEMDGLFLPDFVSFFVPEFVALPETSLEGPADRQPWRAEPLNTLEVCLGPAIHSLAPPAVLP